jgi:anti-sigma B factor antagonist
MCDMARGLNRQGPNWGSMAGLTDLLASATCNLRRNGHAVLPEFSVTIRNLPDLDMHVVELSGELDIVSAGFLTDLLVDVAGSTVVVDLSGLTFMDCSGVAALIAARDRIAANGLGSIVLTEPRRMVRKPLEILGLGDWIVERSPDWAS